MPKATLFALVRRAAYRPESPFTALPGRLAYGHFLLNP